MTSKETKAILMELAVHYKLPIEEVRKICRSQFEFVANEMTNADIVEKLRTIHLPKFVRFDVIKKRSKKIENIRAKRQQDNSESRSSGDS